MNKQGNDVVQIRYKPGDWARDSIGHYVIIMKNTPGGGYYIRYVGSSKQYYKLKDTFREEYVPSVFQSGDVVIFRGKENKVTDIVKMTYSDIDYKYYYELDCNGAIFYESVKSVDTYGEFTES